MDFTSDESGRHLLRLSNLLDAPDYVKESSVVLEDVETLPNAAFGWPHKREFPIDTPGHVWLSYGYCKSASIQDKALLGKLGHAATLYGIADDLQKIDQAFSELTKQASHSRSYAVSMDFGSGDSASANPGVRKGGVQGFYPINTSFEVESSAIKLSNDKSKIPLELYADGCRRIVKAAQELNVSPRMLPRQVLDYGVERVPDEATIKYAAEMRKAATGDDLYEQIAEAATANPEGLASHDFAELWLLADRQNNVKEGSKRQIDPFLLMNSGPTVEQIEREIESFAAIAGAPIPVTKIASMREADVRKRFGKDIADQLVSLVKKAAQATGSELTAAFSDLDAQVQKTFVRLILTT